MSDANGDDRTLHIDALSVARGGRSVLHGVTIDIPPGQVTTLLGPNGTGKSTLVLTVAGVLAPTAGRVLLDDDDLTDARPEQCARPVSRSCRRAGELLPALSVADNMRVVDVLAVVGRQQSGTNT